MTENIVIREATISDARTLSSLAQKTFADTFHQEFSHKADLDAYLDETFSLAKISSSLSRDNNIFWLAVVDDTPVGYAKMKIHSPCPFVEIADNDMMAQLQKIYVLADYLSLKIGLTLQNTLLEKAKSLGRSGAWLSVQDRNTRAIRFYERTGFKKIARHQFSIGRENFEFLAMRKTFD